MTLRASYDSLTERLDTDLGAFLNDVFPDHPAGYTTADEWWDAIGPALESTLDRRDVPVRRRDRPGLGRLIGF